MEDYYLRFVACRAETERREQESKNISNAVWEQP